MGEVQQIVDKLNQAPFDLALSLVSFRYAAPPLVPLGSGL